MTRRGNGEGTPKFAGSQERAGTVGIDVSVVVPTYRDWERLKLCLDSLSRQKELSGSFEIIVVNNDPDDRPPEWFRFPPNAKIVDENNPGAYAARNAGIRVAAGRILAFTDTDCVPAETWLASALRFFRANRHLARLGGRIDVVPATDMPAAAEIYDVVYAFRQDEYVLEKKMAATANMFARRDVFDAVGLFRSELFSGGDTEWGQRAEAAGYGIGYCEHTVVYHPARTTVAELVRKARRVAGGQATMRRSFLRAHAVLVLSVLPPLGSIKRCLSAHVPLHYRLVAFLVRWRLRLTYGVETIRVTYRARPERC